MSNADWRTRGHNSESTDAYSASERNELTALFNQHSEEHERAIVLGVLENAENLKAAHNIFTRVHGEHFYLEKYRLIYVNLMIFFQDNGRVPDENLLIEQGKYIAPPGPDGSAGWEHDGWKQFGCDELAHQLYGQAALSSVSVCIDQHIDGILRYAELRQTSRELYECQKLVRNGSSSDDFLEMIEQLQDKLATIAGRRTAAGQDNALQPLSLALTHPEILNPIPKISTGFPALDDALSGGLTPGGLTYLAARTSDGKSTLLRNMFLRMGQNGISTVLDTLEDGIPESVRKLLSIASGVPTSQILAYQHAEQDGGPTADERRRIREAQEALAALPLMIDGCTDDVNKLCRRVRAAGLQAVLVDQSSWLRDEKSETEYDRARNVSRALKKLAKELGIVVVCAIQVNRTGAKIQSDDLDEIGLHHLRQCGEEDADCVMLIKRVELFDASGAPLSPGLMHLGVDKNRHGARYTRCKLTFDGPRGFIDTYVPDSMEACA
ncbi:MAG TPA: DnaB-like helicase C-terminal domain-containing protein [Planctomycetota bacterium]|nr:DnaB-like helicase C-terminal domain-containing protein [Planctomycetota bacterium]